jgi:hypothetical protein
MRSSAMSLTYLFNTCWMAGCYREARAFERDSQNVRRTQAAILERILRQNRETWFGRKHEFARIHRERDYQNAVPITTYSDYLDEMDRIAAGEHNVLTAQNVQLLEPTGGSTSGEKLIPYTPGLRRSFLQAVRAWIWDLYSKRPAVRSGRSYWSITPLAKTCRRTSAGIPIGFESDTHYLSRGERLLVERTVVTPPEVLKAPSVEAARYATLFHLLRARDLSLISAWSPTFLTGLFRFLVEHKDRLVSDIAEGRITVDIGGALECSRRQYAPSDERSKEIQQIFDRNSNEYQWPTSLWPSLALVSCWADGPSLVHANNLRQYLGGIELQPKGLLATEAIVTIPLLACVAPALAIRSHFFEFLPVTTNAASQDTRPLLADELTEGNRYRVLVTTDGGLYRYDLHDEVEVHGYHNHVPLLRFVGKTSEFSDLVGEKLYASHVQVVLQRAFEKFHLNPIYAQLCASSSGIPGYAVKLCALEVANSPDLRSRLCAEIEGGLKSNPGYKYAREMGQLYQLELELVDEIEANAIGIRETAERISTGQRLGDVKPTSLQSVSLSRAKL